jgi:hypothetical protein
VGAFFVAGLLEEKMSGQVECRKTKRMDEEK